MTGQSHKGRHTASAEGFNLYWCFLQFHWWPRAFNRPDRWLTASCSDSRAIGRRLMRAAVLQSVCSSDTRRLCWNTLDDEPQGQRWYHSFYLKDQFDILGSMLGHLCGKESSPGPDAFWSSSTAFENLKKTNSFIVTQHFFALEAFLKKKKILRVLYAIGMEHYMRRLTPLAVLVWYCTYKVTARRKLA